MKKSRFFLLQLIISILMIIIYIFILYNTEKGNFKSSIFKLGLVTFLVGIGAIYNYRKNK